MQYPSKYKVCDRECGFMAIKFHASKFSYVEIYCGITCCDKCSTCTWNKFLYKTIKLKKKLTKQEQGGIILVIKSINLQVGSHLKV